MKVLLSTIGSRGDVQPILAVAVELRALGHEATLCVPPNFKEWIESHGVACVPIGPDVKTHPAGSAMPKAPKLSPAQLQQLADGMVHGQFATLGSAARGCVVVVGAGALQVATRSVAESIGARYVHVSYCPVTFASPLHAPPKMGQHHPFWLPGVVNRLLWTRDEQSWNARFGPALNAGRAALGLPPVASVPRHIATDAPWLAADPLLGPASRIRGLDIVQTGAWLLRDETPLPTAVERFLAAGEPPIYFGFGSMRGPSETARTLVDTARALGRRAVLSQGWAGFDAADAGDDVFVLGDVDHAKLLPRVAAIVHHGGAGTTTAAARAGRPQLIVPHNFDQFYWRHRVSTLGIGVAGPMRAKVTVDNLARALQDCLRARTVARARELAPRIEVHGAANAARQLETLDP